MCFRNFSEISIHVYTPTNRKYLYRVDRLLYNINILVGGNLLKPGTLDDSISEVDTKRAKTKKETYYFFVLCRCHKLTPRDVYVGIKTAFKSVANRTGESAIGDGMMTLKTLYKNIQQQ